MTHNKTSHHSYQFKDHSILTRNDEYQLFEQYNKTKSPEIKQQIKNHIITHNMKFAAKCANTYIAKYPHVDPDDIKGYAMMGMIDTIDRFDYTLGIKFTSYAVWWIKNCINRNVETFESLVRYPANIHQQLQKEINARKFSNEILTMVNTVRGGQSLTKPFDEGNRNIHNNSLIDVLEDTTVENTDDMLESNELKDQINTALDSLNDNEKFIMKAAYGFHSGEKRALRDIALELNVTHDSVRYIRNNCIKKLKKRLKLYD